MTCDELGGPELTPERGGEEHEYCSTDLTIAKLSSPSDYSEMYMYKVIYSDILVQGYRYSDLHVYKVIYSNSKCTTAGPSPMVQEQCINAPFQRWVTATPSRAQSRAPPPRRRVHVSSGP